MNVEDMQDSRMCSDIKSEATDFYIFFWLNSSINLKFNDFPLQNARPFCQNEDKNETADSNL